ncbi:MAG: D-alanyl-D-alanine carboxypeptidase family protein [Acutalibacteraceae bacterium]
MSDRPDDYGDFFESINFDEEALREEYRRKANIRRKKEAERKRRRRQTYLLRFSTVLAIVMLAVGITAVCTGLFGQIEVADTVNNDVSVVDTDNSKAQTNTEKKEENLAVTEVSSEKDEEGSKEESSKEESSNPHIEIEPLKNTFAHAEIANKSEIAEKLSTKYVFLYDATHDKVLYDNGGKQKCYPASTTKILTAIVAQAIIPEDMEITVGEEINLIGEDSSTAYLSVGYVMNLKMLLQGLLLPSGNDAAYVLAVNAARVYTGNDKLSYDEALAVFADLMNDTARQIGATGTHFVVPDGFHNDDHYTTAEDLAKIATYAYSIPIIKEICSTFAVNCETLSGEVLYWENSNSLINPYSNLYNKNVTGMKTGFTSEAGTCLVATAEVDDVLLIGVLMNAENLYKKYDDTNFLFQKGFQSLGLSYYDY